jgi:Sulfotransferase family
MMFGVSKNSLEDELGNTGAANAPFETGLTLILGAPRSGTSWLGKIFDSHPDVIYRHEPDSTALGKRLSSFYGYDFASSADARAYLRRLADIRSAKTVGALPIFRKSHHSRSEHLAQLLEIYAMLILARVRGSSEAAPTVQPGNVNKAIPEQARPVVIKSVSLLQHAGVFARSVPELTIIAIVRHPCDTIASQLLGRRTHKLPNRAPNPAIANSEQARRRGLSPNEFAAMTLADQLAYQWLIAYEKAIEELAGRANCRIVRYEDLVASAQSTASELFAFAHLPRSEATARFIERSQNSHWPSRYFGVLRPPSFRAKAERWREGLSPSEAQRILDIVSDSAPGRLYL